MIHSKCSESEKPFSDKLRVRVFWPILVFPRKRFQTKQQQQQLQLMQCNEKKTYVVMSKYDGVFLRNLQLKRS